MTRERAPCAGIGSGAIRIRRRGFSLIELAMAIMIAGLLVSIAVPTYRDYVLRANRADARASLLGLAAAEEKFYLQCYTYATHLDESQATACSQPSLNFPTTTERRYYAIQVTAADTSGWTATATAVSGSPQANDSSCQRFRLTSAGARTAEKSSGTPNDLECWSR